MSGDNQPLTLSLSKGWYLSLATVAVWSLLALLSFPNLAHACLCASPGSPKEAMADADAVFFGRVTGMAVRSNDSGTISSADPTTVEFDVIRVWKGPLRETLTVETERSGISCGYEFKEGRKYIVYTWGGNRTGLCTRTGPAWLAVRDFVALGFGQAPQSSGEPDGKLPETPTSYGPGCSALSDSGRNRMDFAAPGLLAGVLALGIIRRRRL